MKPPPPAHAKGTALGALQEHGHDEYDDDHEMDNDQHRGMERTLNRRLAAEPSEADRARV
jgi:hypothetical protein